MKISSFRLYKLLLFISVGIILSYCTLLNISTKKNYPIVEIPPGQIKISETLFADFTAVTNFHWLEYLYWLKRVYGDTAKEYLAALPDENCWKEAYDCLSSLDESYLRHPKYREFPVVGITQEQAKNYTNWRTDRVFEYQLVKLKVIPYNTEPSPTNYFSVARYFNNELDYPRDPSINFYLSFSLPTKEEHKTMITYNDSLFATRKKNQGKTKEQTECIHTNILPCKEAVLLHFPTRPVTTDCVNKKDKMLYNLIGNVAEWLNEKDLVAGLSWKDKFNSTIDSRHEPISANAWTGFRNTAKWKKWDD